MKFSEVCRWTLTGCVAAVMLAGCGGSQPPIGAPGAVQSSSIDSAHVNPKAWILKDAKESPLLYVSNNINYGTVSIFSYPRGKLVGMITGLFYPAGLCTDTSGNIYVPAEAAGETSEIYEFSHGGTEPIKTLADPGFASSCSYDPSTGNLAVTNILDASHPSEGSLAIFKAAEGSPTIYYDPYLGKFLYCAYNNSGDLFVDNLTSDVLAMLPAAGSRFKGISLSQQIAPMSLQWLKDRLIVGGAPTGHHGPAKIYEIKVSGTAGIVSGPVVLSNRATKTPNGVQFLVLGKTIVGPDYNNRTLNRVNYWAYPQGGNPTKIIKGGDVNFYGVALSAK